MLLKGIDWIVLDILCIWIYWQLLNQNIDLNWWEVLFYYMFCFCHMCESYE